MTPILASVAVGIKEVILIVIVFGVLFYLAQQFLTGVWKNIAQFLCGAIIVVVLLLFLLGLF